MHSPLHGSGLPAAVSPASLVYIYFGDSHFNSTPSSSTIHLTASTSNPSSPPSSVISSHHRASLITSSEDICSSSPADLSPLTIVATSSSPSSPPSLTASVVLESHCTPLDEGSATAIAKGGQGLSKMDHADASSVAVDLVKRASPLSHHHVPVIASTAGYNLAAASEQQQQQSVQSNTGRIADSSHANEVSITVAGAAEVQPRPPSDSDKVTVCDSLLASRARPQPSQSSPSSSATSTSTSAAASSSILVGASETHSTDRHSESSDYGSLAGSKSSKDRESPFSSPDEGIDMEDVEVEFNKNSAQSKDTFLLKRISNDLEYSSPHLKRRRKDNVHLQEILSGRHDAHKDLVDICNKNEIFAHEPTTPIGGKGGVGDDSSMLKENANAYRRTLYQCTWPACSYRCMACHLIEQHVRVEHLGRSETDPIDNEDSDREEEFYYNEMEIDEQTQSATPPPAHSAFSSTASSASSSSSSAVSSAISPLSPTAPPSPAGNSAPLSEPSVAVSLANGTTAASDLVSRSSSGSITTTALSTLPAASPPLPSPVIYRPSPLVASAASSHYRLINSQLLAAAAGSATTAAETHSAIMASHKFAADVPMDLSPRSKQTTTPVESPVVTTTSGSDQSKSVSPFTSPLLLVSSATPTSLSAPAVVTPISPVSSPVLPSVPFNAIYPHHRPLAELTASAASLIQQKLFHQFSFNAASTSPSSLSSHSSHSSASSAYFSSSPTSSTKSWTQLDEIMLNGAVARSVANEAKLASQLSPSVAAAAAVAASSQPDPSVVTHSVSHLLSHDSSPASFSERGVVVLNKSNVIKFGMRKDQSQPQGKPLDLHTQPKQSISTSAGALAGLPDIKPILAAVTSSNPSGAAILPLPLTSPLATATTTGSKPATGLSNGTGIPTVPRRRGRPPGSTNKKKKLQQQLQQQQQLIMSLMPSSGPLNPAALVGHPFITSAGLLAPSDHLSQLSCSQFAAAFAAVSAQSANAIGLKPPGTGRKPRGESRKCRKVYGMDNRDMWCTQCKWKKACSRFTEP